MLLLNNKGLTSQLAADMKKVVNNKEYSDFQFLIEDKIIYAHKIILFARSKYFKDILEKTPEIASFKVEDFSYDVFMLVIEYIYTDHVKPLTSDLVDLSKAAAHFQLERLATLCGNSTVILSIMIVYKYYFSLLSHLHCLQII